ATLLYTLALDGVMVRPDTRTVAAAWLTAHAIPEKSIALASPPWFYTPPLTPTLGFTKVLSLLRVPPLPPVGFTLITPARGLLTPEELAVLRPDFVVVSEFEDRDALRAARVTGQPNPMLALQRALDREYQAAVSFVSR